MPMVKSNFGILSFVCKRRETSDSFLSLGVFMPGPAPTPIPLKLLRGNPGKKSIRTQFEPERLPKVPDPPKFLEGYAKDEWRRVAPSLHTLGLLSALDLMPFAAYCISYQHWRKAEERLGELAVEEPESRGLLVKVREGHARRSPLVQIAASAAADMLRFASEFGMTPAARARISTGVGREPAGKFDGLIES
jgi:P27 family predicted phage terminase small subunit